MTRELTRLDALRALVESPDEPTMPRRASIRTQEPNRKLLRMYPYPRDTRKAANKWRAIWAA